MDERGSAMVRLAARILGDVGDAEDAVQEAFARVYGALDAGTLVADAHMGTYLYRAVTNAALDALRQKRRRGFWTRLFGADEEEPEGREVSPEVTAALGELSAFVLALPDEQRMAIVLKDVEGWSSGEIAAARGCSEGAIEQRLLRARATLRAQLKPEGKS